MAGTLTHFKFMEDLAKKIDYGDNRNLFFVSGQGHDLLYFIKLKDYRNFAKQSVIAKVIASSKFKVLVTKWQKEVLRTNNKELECILYGYIAHHVLDSYIHPWINYDCGCYLNDERHEMLESVLDVLIYDPYKFNVPKISISKDTIAIINSLFNDVYNVENVGTLFSKGMKNIRGFIKIYRRDKFGIKRIGYKIIDKMTKKDYKKYTFLSFNYSNKEKIRIREKYLEEFRILYDKALDESVGLINKIRSNLANKKIADIAFDKSAI